MPKGDAEIREIYSLRALRPRPEIALRLATIIGPAEELFWRGLIQGGLARRFGRWPGAALATGAYGGVHLVSRVTENKGNFAGVYGETGRAIVGGLITSGVGFSAMLLADHPGLNSMGRLAILGFAINLIVMLIFFPAVLLWLQHHGLIASTEPESNSAAAGSSEAKDA